MRRLRSALLFPALLLALAAPALRAQSVSFDPDDPRSRGEWNAYWFGTVTPGYLAFKNAAAAQEIARWGGTFPSAARGARPLPTAAPTPGAWTNLGPTTSTSFPDVDSGRPVSIVVDPTASNTIYLATSGGGVWKATNADPTANTATVWSWTPITDNLPASSGTGGNVSCGALAMSPVDHLTLYLALGDPFDAAGTGIYKTTDGGSTWTAANLNGLTPTRSHAILPLDANNVFVGTDIGLLKSTDGGASFNAVSLPTSGAVWSIQAFDASNLICTVTNTPPGSAPTGHLLYSSDGGVTWSSADMSGLSSAIPTIGNIVVATSAASTTQAWGMAESAPAGADTIARGLLKTTDKGHTWTFVAAPTVAGGLFQGTGPQMSTDGQQGFYNYGLAVDPTNVNRVFMGANLAFYRTTDGGANWTQLTHWYGSGHPYVHADYHCTAWSPDHTKLYVGQDGGMALFEDPFRATIPTTTDDLTFVDNRHNVGLITHLCYFLGSTQASNAADSGDRIAVGMQDNGTRVRQPQSGVLAGSSTFDDEIGGDGFGTVWSSGDATKVLGSIYYADIYRSTNGGSSFTESISGITEAKNSGSAPFQSHLALGNNATPDTVYTHANTNVYKSTDFGATWTAMTTAGLPGSYAIRNIGASRTTDAVGIAADSGRVFLYYPATGAWTGSTSDVTGGARNTGAVWFDTQNDQTVYLSSVAANSSVHHLWKSVNGGSSWTSIDGTSATSNGLPFGIPVHCIQNLPGSSSTLFAGTDFGVYQSLNGGASWTRFGTGLPLVASRDLYLAPDKSIIRVATFGRGVWEASLAAASAVSISKQSASSVGVGGTVTFAATSTLAPTTVAWTATSGGPFSPTTTPGDGTTLTTYTAPASIAGVSQSVTVTATGSDGTTKATANLTVFNPAAVTLSVSPSTAQTLFVGKTLAFTGTTNYGTVAWSATGGSFSPATTPGDGTTQATFTAPATVGNVTVTAQSAGTASQQVTVHVRSLDVNGDGVVDVRDLLALMAAYGHPSTPATDLDGSGAAVGDNDLTVFLNNF